MFFLAFDGKHLLLPMGICPGWVGRELAGGLSFMLIVRLWAWQEKIVGTGECVWVCVRETEGGRMPCGHFSPADGAVCSARCPCTAGHETLLCSWPGWRWHCPPVASRVGPCCRTANQCCHHLLVMVLLGVPRKDCGGCSRVVQMASSILFRTLWDARPPPPPPPQLSTAHQPGAHRGALPQLWKI